MPKDIQPDIDHLASLLVNTEVLTNLLVEDIDDIRLVMVKNNLKSAHMVAAELLKKLKLKVECGAEPPGGK